MAQEDVELKLLDDLPVGVEGDEFEHGFYADMLASIFRSGKPGRCVGFFGKWGQGKSSVVQQMEEKLGGCKTVITFNAWKASGDSIRRQLLLSVVKRINPNEYTKLKTFVGIDVLRKLLLSKDEEEEQCKQERKHARRKTLLDPGFWGRDSMLFIVAIVFLLLGLGLVVISFVFNVLPLLTIALALPIPASISLAMYVRKLVHVRYLGHLTIGEELSESHRIRYPEQFEELFITNVTRYCLKHPDLVVVIDDLDRCDAQTVAQALAAIRQFTPDALRRAGERDEDFRCQFLVPCDEQQVVLALETAGHDAGKHGARTHDYESKELLRKFFDVTLRMHDINQDDFLDYASTLAEVIDLDPHDAMELVALVQPDDPRLVKQLLNALCISHARLARQRKLEAFPPEQELPDLEKAERLIVALRETIPSVYSWIAADPSILQEDNHPAWKRMSQRTEDRESQTSVGWNEPSIIASRGEVDRAKKMLRNAGRVSAATAEILVHSKLPKLLQGVVGGGSLILSLRHSDQKRFNDVVSSLESTKQLDVQLWLSREARRISERTASGLRQLVSLFLSYWSIHPEEDFIGPCLQAALTPTRNLQEALSDHPELEELATFLPRLESRISDRILAALTENFLSTGGKSDPELQFLLATCTDMPAKPKEDFREWLVDGLKDAKKEGEFVARVSRLLPEDRSLCSGFAPEGAVTAAHRAQWEDLDDGTGHPRQDVIMTLLGDSSAHAAQCLEAILDDGGQLANPRPITGTSKPIESAWVTVGDLLALVDDATEQKLYPRIHSWLNQGIDNGTKVILDALGWNAFRLSDAQLSQLAQSISGWLIKQPRYTWLLEFVGSESDDKSLVSGWTRLAASVFEKYARWLRNANDLPAAAKPVIKRITELQWPVTKSAEGLLVGKLDASSQLRQFQPWLDALAPLVRAGSSYTKIREKILEHIDRKSAKADMAIAAGLALPWEKEIDGESAASVGQLFISTQSSLSQYGDFWRVLRETKGAGKVLDAMASELPEEIPSLMAFRNSLTMLAEDFVLLSGKHKKHFLNETVLSLVSNSDRSSRELGITLASQSSRTTGALRKQLTLLIKEGNLSSEEEQDAKAAKGKPLLRTARETAA